MHQTYPSKSYKISTEFEYLKYGGKTVTREDVVKRTNGEACKRYQNQVTET